MRFPPQSNLELPYLFFDWVNLHWYACGADGRSRDYQNFSDAYGTHGAPLRTRESFTIKIPPYR